jgi:hypothetical protein
LQPGSRSGGPQTEGNERWIGFSPDEGSFNSAAGNLVEHFTYRLHGSP